MKRDLALDLVENTRLQNHLGELLDEQRYAIGPADDLIDQSGGQMRIPDLRRITSATCWRLSRLSVTWVRCVRPSRATNSGREVSTQSSRSAAPCWTIMPRTSNVEASTQ